MKYRFLILAGLLGLLLPGLTAVQVFSQTADAPPAPRTDQADEREQASDQEDKAQQPGRQRRPWIPRRRASKFERNHVSVRQAFEQVVQASSQSTVRVQSEGKQVALGVVVSDGGQILTKASELKGTPHCVLPDSSVLAARVIGVHRDTDLALLQVESTGLKPLEWSKQDPAVGDWVATPGWESLPLAVGVVSVLPRKIPPANGGLGVRTADDPQGARVVEVVADSQAEKAGLLVGDIIQSVNQTPITNNRTLRETIMALRPDDRVMLKLIRGDQTLKQHVTLGHRTEIDPMSRRNNFQNHLGNQLSRRRTGFSSVIQHDTFLTPPQCGGALVGLDGKAVGINIARAGRVSCYTLPSDVVLPVLEELKSGQLAPHLVYQKEIEEIDQEMKQVSLRIEQQFNQRLTELQKQVAQLQQQIVTAQSEAAKAAKELKEAQQEKKRTEQQIELTRSDLEKEEQAKRQLERRRLELVRGTTHQ